MRRRFPLQAHIATLFLILVLLLGAALGGLGWRVSSQVLEASAVELNARNHREVLASFSRLIEPAETATRLLAREQVANQHTLEARLAALPFMRELLATSPALTSLYVGYADGDFFMLRKLGDAAEHAWFRAPPDAEFVVQIVERDAAGATGRFTFLDANLKPLATEQRDDLARDFDPRKRGWFEAAQRAGTLVKTAPYAFFTTAKVGITIAAPAREGGAVVGADIRLETLDTLLARLRPTPGTHLALVSTQGKVVAAELLAGHSPAAPLHDNVNLPELAQLPAPVFAQVAPLLAALPAPGAAEAPAQRIEAGGETWRVELRRFESAGAPPLVLVSAIPDRELMAAARGLVHNLALTMGAIMLLAVPVTLLLARNISSDLQRLAHEAEAIRSFDFTAPIAVQSPVLEVDQLVRAMDLMKRTIRRFLDITLAVASETNFGRLLPRLLGETISAAEARAGVLYLAENGSLQPAAALDAAGERWEVNAKVIDLAAAGPLFDAALVDRRAWAAPLKAADTTALGYGAAGEHAIAVPLTNRQHVLVGAMVLLRDAPADATRVNFIEALSGSAAVSLESQELIHAQKALFEAFIKLIAGAIDAKSEYTGGHCARVPELAKMLARAACAAKEGPYRDFDLDENEWEALHLAAWLHDCGKVTTPEYVVDKATKLATLYDRIHEIRMRFEVIKRDAEIAALKRINAGANASEEHAALATELAALDEEFAFVAKCNQGGEAMSAEDQVRLREIAARRWLRTLDDRLGVSYEEHARRAAHSAPALPVEEALLADKPEHRISRGEHDTMPAENPWGFRMPAPELLYNQGELHNLSVGRGTLSEEERHKINEHIVQTIIMLSALPYPKHLRNVPEIAGGHHEKMDGTGYPKRIAGNQMSPLARTMAIADIFEALTAVDRPYKKGKTLSEALAIMSRMAREGHIDPELFDLFLNANVYRDYAQRYMRPEQIDEVEVGRYRVG